MKKHTIIIVLTSLVILAVICVIGNVFTCLSMNISLIRRLVDFRGKRPSIL